MRITLTTPALDGGIGRNLVNLANCWHELGVDVDLIIDHECSTQTPGLSRAVNVFESGGSHPVGKVPWLAWYLRKRRPAGLLTPVPRHTVWALRARRFSHAPIAIVANIHSNYLKTAETLRPGKRRGRLSWLRRYYPQCNFVVAVSQGAASAFSRLTGMREDRLTVIPNPVVTPELATHADMPVNHPWFIGEGPPVVIWVGRLDQPKNPGLLFEAFDRLRTNTVCRLVIVGTGTEESALVRRAHASPHREDIAFLGHQDNPYRFMRRSAVLVLSSSWEGFGNVLVEAMALGVPVVSTDCPSGPAEILEGGRWGPLVPVDDAAALAEGIRQCLIEPLPPAVLMEAAQRYRADRVADQYLQLFSGNRG